MNIASLESLELLFSNEKKKYHCVTFKGSACHSLTKDNYAKNRIILIDLLPDKKMKDIFKIWLNEKKVISSTNLTTMLKNKKIHALSLDMHSSPYMETWAKKENRHLIVTPWKMQKKIENKIFFEQFLSKNNIPSPKSWILKKKSDIQTVNIFPAIIQIPNSTGSKGTFLIKNKKEILQLISSKQAKLPLLCREFIDHGIPLGVSILISPKKMIFSALRLQAYFSQKNGKSIYYGIQWIKTSSFPKKTIRKLNSFLETTGKALQKIGFRGIASLDLVLRNGEIYFIECNPRLGGATPQISFKKDLNHGFNFVEEFTKSTCGKELSAHKPFIPNSKYEGFNLDLDFLADLHPEIRVNMPKTGFYKYNKKEFIYLSSKINEFRKSSTMFLYHTRQVKTRLSPKRFTGFSMINRPLLNLNKKGYAFSANGKKFIKNIENFILK